jgi:mono/diheme cytochrome c family protein
MKRFVILAVGAYAVLLASLAAAPQQPPTKSGSGQQIFRFDTFGDEQLWTKTLRMQEALATVSPETALAVGLKVDVEALPPAVVEALKAGKVNLKDPAVTLQLLSANAVVGVVGKVNGKTLDSVGITCALCHSNVDNSLTKGVGKRLDGWANRDLNVGAIVALSPALTDAQRGVFKSWGPGKYDPRLQAFDGTKLRSLNSTSVPVMLPAIAGLRGVEFETYTGDGPISYWNAYVGVGQMGGQGNFHDKRIGLEITQSPDRVTSKLPALLDYQLSLRSPAPPAGSFDRAAAGRGQALFNSSAKCATCHMGPTFTDVARNKGSKTPLLHSPAEIGADPAYALRSATKMYRTAPLRGVWQHPPYFHDGRAADLMAVVNHYDKLLSLGLTAAQKADLVEYLKSL